MRRRLVRLVPAGVGMVVALAFAIVSWNLWTTNFRPDDEPRLASSDMVVLRWPYSARKLNARFRFTVTPPGSEIPSRLELNVGEVPARDPAKRLREKPDRPQTVTMTISDQLAAQISNCRTGKLQPRGDDTVLTQAPVRLGSPAGPGRDLAVLRSSMSYDLGNGDRRLPEDRLARWFETHKPLRQFRLSVITFDDGSAAAELTCEIGSAYLWAKRNSNYALTTPRLLLSAPSPQAASTADALAVVNWTSVATSDSFWFERGKEDVSLFPHTAEFSDQSEHGTSSNGESNEFVWETITTFGSAESQRDRDVAVLLLGVLLAAVLQFATRAASSAWSAWQSR